MFVGVIHVSFFLSIFEKVQRLAFTFMSDEEIDRFSVFAVKIVSDLLFVFLSFFFSFLLEQLGKKVRKKCFYKCLLVFILVRVF